MTDRAEAMSAIDRLDITSKHKSTKRLLWRRIHEPQFIGVRPSSSKKNMTVSKQQLRIEILKNQIEMLQKELAELRVQTSGDRCFVCKKDPEGYDLPCGHEICHPCFKCRLQEGKITCQVCHKEFFFQEAIEDEDETSPPPMK